jgi:hypothetical protein
MAERSDDPPVPGSGAQVTRAGSGHLDKWWAGAAHAQALSQAAAVCFSAERERLRALAEAIEVETMERLRARRLLEQRGRGARLGLRIRAPRRPGGSFTIEWFLARGPGRTKYLPRGDGDAYARPAFALALPWERQIALAAERPLAEIRLRLRLMKQTERSFQQTLARLAQPLPDERQADAEGQAGDA